MFSIRLCGITQGLAQFLVFAKLCQKILYAKLHITLSDEDFILKETKIIDNTIRINNKNSILSSESVSPATLNQKTLNVRSHTVQFVRVKFSTFDKWLMKEILRFKLKLKKCK
ncbi:hypothetical protein BpHYR1_001316 [Brachionus plicatilis]|uniref:Uncharacterized protein n=1 Tax=Brachionus plicatilis TaxID=10195 RepID=A0A3M7T7X4_BRAPC|nr:hypothetical protein BpHYR1_001316 [Brachionus plicatilis]